MSRLEKARRQLFLLAMCWLWLAGPGWAAITPEQRRLITDFESEISIAGRLYTNDKFDESAAKVGSAQ